MGLKRYKGWKPRSLEERFWDHILIGETCWAWTGGKDSFGYGKLWRGLGKTGRALAHRVSWELFYGPIPPGLQVLHRCDNPFCVCPGHLFLGTQKDNMVDMVFKGRGRWNKKAPRQVV